MHTKEHHLYYDQNDIVIEDKDTLTELATKWYPKIISHEISGLMSLGCTLETRDDSIILHNHSRPQSAFLNRVIAIHCQDQQSIAHLYDSTGHVAFEINPFSTPDNLECALVQNGATHTLSSVVLGKELPDIRPIPKISFRVILVSDTHLETSAFSIFSTFFLKNEESPEEAALRFSSNIGRGPHLVAFDEERPIGMIGSIVVKDIASVYACIIDPHYRFGNELPIKMEVELEKALRDLDVSFVYYKSRNKAIVLGGKIYLGLKHLYNERVYEKK